MSPSRRDLVFIASLVTAPTLAVAQAAPGDADAPPRPPSTTSSVALRRCGTPQVRGLVASPVQHAAAGQRTLFLNRNGGRYHIVNGATNSATQSASRIVSADGQPREVVIAPMSATFNWSSISACVRDHYKTYDLRVVETRPTSGVYIEAVVGGNGTELGFGANDLFGIAAADHFCGVTEAGIAFSFAETHRDVPRRDAELCATIAHEVGHLLALEHETLATDLMSYVLVADTTSKAFVDQDVPCGVVPGQNQSCSCAPGTTNSAARLRQFVGNRPMETVPPTLTVVEPGEGDEIPPSVTVVAEASDDLEMSQVTVLVNGLERASDLEPDGNRYEIPLTDLADGPVLLTVLARDRAGNETSVTVNATVARLGIGASCTTGDECAGGQCAMQGGESFCTQTCDLANDTCPDDWTCTAAGAISVCAGSSGGCCDAGQSPGPGAGLLVLGVGFVLVRRRRARA